MSVRAYKVISKEVENNPSFNLWRDGDLLDMLMGYGEYTDYRNDDGNGQIEFSVGGIRKVLKKYKWEKDDYRKIQLQKDIEGLTDNDWVEYECY